MKPDFQQLKEIREKLSYTQAQMAEFMGLNRSYLAGLENGTRPLNRRILNKAQKIERRVLDINFKGSGRRIFEEFAQFIKDLEENANLFSLEELHDVSNHFMQNSEDSPEAAEPFYDIILDILAVEIVHRHVSLTAKSRKDITSGTQSGQNEVLTSITPKSNTGGVKSEIQKLIERVKSKALKQPGAKAELARTLGVAPARISEWLSGTKEPGGEYTLQLLKWVQ